jgi:methylmalonyl-CoA mutase cobalamin-binding subunit
MVMAQRSALIWRLRAPDQGSTVGGLLSVSPPEEHHERPRFADVAAIQERVTAVLRSILKEAFADSFQKLYERCQQYVVKHGDYFEGQ